MLFDLGSAIPKDDRRLPALAAQFFGVRPAKAVVEHSPRRLHHACRDSGRMENPLHRARRGAEGRAEELVIFIQDNRVIQMI